MRKPLTLLIVLAFGIGATPAAGAPATSPRADSYYEAFCYQASTNTWWGPKRVDVNAEQLTKTPGGEDTAMANYNLHNPDGWVCELRGPYTP